jgi:hypothetical protein
MGSGAACARHRIRRRDRHWPPAFAADRPPIDWLADRLEEAGILDPNEGDDGDGSTGEDE